MLDDDCGGFLDGTTSDDKIVSGVDRIAKMVEHLPVPSHRLHRRSGGCHELVSRGQARRVPHGDASFDVFADLRLHEVRAPDRAAWWRRAA